MINFLNKMIIFTDKDRSDIDEWLNQKGEVPKKIDSIKKKSVEFSYLVLYTNRLSNDIIDTSIKRNICLLNNGQSLNISKSTLQIKDLLLNLNKRIKTQDGKNALSACIDFFMILDIEVLLAKNVKKNIFNTIKESRSYIEYEKIKLRNYFVLDCKSIKLEPKKIIEDFIDYEKAKKLNYYSSYCYYNKKK